MPGEGFGSLVLTHNRRDGRTLPEGRQTLSTRGVLASTKCRDMGVLVTDTGRHPFSARNQRHETIAKPARTPSSLPLPLATERSGGSPSAVPAAERLMVSWPNGPQ
jgi:hypothetical protein